MEYYNRFICVTVDELTEKESGPAIMTLSNYNTLVKRKRLHVVRPGKGLGCYALIDFNSLPERFRVAFEEKYGKPADILKKKDISGDSLVQDSLATQWFADYILPNGEHLTEDQIEEYTWNATVLNELVKIINEREALRNALGGRHGGIRQFVLNAVEKFRNYPGHTLPSSWVRVKEKIDAYKEHGYESVISGRVGNNNALKITEEAGNLIIALKRAKVPRRYNTEQLFEEFNRQAAERGWKPLKSITSLTQFLNRPDIQRKWYDARHGELAAKQRYTRKHKTLLPTMPNGLWYGDGTKLNLYYKGFDKSGKIALCTTNVYEVVDAYSEVLLGFHISDSENFDAQYQAFRMATETAGCRPYEVVTDNQGGHKKAEALLFFERLARVSRRTAPYNPQSKSIEQIFGRFQAQVLAQDWRFTGQNITAKKAESRPDLEFIEANVENLYTLPQLIQAYEQYREQWNLQPHPATGRPRWEMYQDGVNPKTQPLTLRDKVDLFWRTTDEPSTFTSNGLTITVNKQEYTYEVFDANGLPDLAFRKAHTYRQFVVKYDPLDMTQVRLYIQEKDDLRFVTTAYPYATIHRGIQEQQPGEMAFIQQMQELQNMERVSHQVEMAALEMAHGVAPEQHGLNRPRVKGIKADALEYYMDMAEAEQVEATMPANIGSHDKIISNQTYDQVGAYSKF